MKLDISEDEMSRAKEVIALQKKHDQEKETEKDKLEKEKEERFTEQILFCKWYDAWFAATKEEDDW